MSLNIGYSSEIYDIDPQDLEILPDAESAVSAHIHCNDDIIVLIGNAEQHRKDTLVCGRRKIQEALRRRESYVPVRFAFVSNIAAWNIFPLFIKQLRYKYKYNNTNIYHVSARRLREQKLERGQRNAANAYAITNKRWAIPENDRRRKYQELVASMQNGFDDRLPISIMLCRRCGLLDSIDNGHHRLGICIDYNIDRIATNFIAAGKAPSFICNITHLISKLFKQLNNQH